MERLKALEFKNDFLEKLQDPQSIEILKQFEASIGWVLTLRRNME